MEQKVFAAQGIVTCSTVSKSDYAGNACDFYDLGASPLFTDPTIGGILGPIVGHPLLGGTPGAGTGIPGFKAAVGANPTVLNQVSSIINQSSQGQGGIFYYFSVVTMGQITDGTASTYLAGEKYLNPDFYYGAYTSGADYKCDDMQPALVGGADGPTTRYADIQPVRDTPGYLAMGTFGSPHVGGFNMAFCDGSVHTISFGISDTVHLQLGDRADGSAVDMGALAND
jgi:prepilin-type processing-associated H-X9-DG protein